MDDQQPELRTTIWFSSQNEDLSHINIQAHETLVTCTAGCKTIAWESQMRQLFKTPTRATSTCTFTHTHLVLTYNTKDTAYPETVWKNKQDLKCYSWQENPKKKVNIYHQRGLALPNTGIQNIPIFSDRDILHENQYILVLLRTGL